MKNIIKTFCLLTFLLSNVSFSQTQLGDDLLGEAAQNLYGYSIALNADGTMLGIGAVGYEGNGFQSGYVQIFAYESGNWNQVGSNLLGQAADDRFGTSISFNASGTRIAIGAPYHRVDGTNVAGHVKVFDLIGGAWQQVGGNITSPINFSAFGTSVKLNSTGEFLIIGAENHSEGSGSTLIGSTRVYRLNGGAWEQIGADIDGDNQNDHSGFSVDINDDGSIIAISHYRSEGDTGKVRMFKLNSSDQWVQLGNSLTGDDFNNQFGYSINMNALGDRVVIGEKDYGTPGGPTSGRVSVYDYNSSTDTWDQLGQDIFGDENVDFHGYSVDISGDGNVLITGAPGNSESGFWNGEMQLFKLNGNTWNQVGMDVNGVGSQSFLGSSVAISNDSQVIAVASSSSNASGFTNAGIVEVFSIANVLSNNEEILNEVSVFKTQNEKLKVVIKGSGKYQMELYDLTGKIVLNEVANIESNYEIGIPKLSRGIYIFKLKSVGTGKVSFKKIIL